MNFYWDKFIVEPENIEMNTNSISYKYKCSQNFIEYCRNESNMLTMETILSIPLEVTKYLKFNKGNIFFASNKKEKNYPTLKINSWTLIKLNENNIVTYDNQKEQNIVTRRICVIDYIINFSFLGINHQLAWCKIGNEPEYLEHPQTKEIKMYIFNKKNIFKNINLSTNWVDINKFNHKLILIPLITSNTNSSDTLAIKFKFDRKDYDLEEEPEDEDEFFELKDNESSSDETDQDIEMNNNDFDETDEDIEMNNNESQRK